MHMSPHTHPSDQSAPAIDATAVTVSLGGAPIVRGVDLRMGQGEVVALLGANGSGKSTLVRALVGVVPLDSGAVRLLGSPLGRTAPWERIGYVPQRVSAATGVPATAREVVVSGTLHGNHLRPPRDARTRAGAALASVGLGAVADNAVRTLSGGQQQRVLIARALVRHPELLLLDEPVAGVDLPSQRTFAAALAELAATGTTILVVLHELGALAPLIQRAVVLRHGAVVHDGAPPVPQPEHAGPEHVHLHPHDGDRDPAAGDQGIAPAVRWQA